MANPPRKHRGTPRASERGGAFGSAAAAGAVVLPFVPAAIREAQTRAEDAGARFRDLQRTLADLGPMGGTEERVELDLALFAMALALEGMREEADELLARWRRGQATVDEVVHAFLTVASAVPG
jgi:hypothetical protein